MPIDRRTLFTAALAASATPALAAASLRDSVLGAWSLLEAVTVHPDGTTTPWMGRQGPHTGLIIYSPSGRMSVQISSARPALASGASVDALPAAEQAAFLTSYYGYFGRFEVDDAASEVRHILQGNLNPAQAGATLVRKVSLSGDRLALTTPPSPPDGTYSRLTWLRA